MVSKLASLWSRGLGQHEIGLLAPQHWLAELAEIFIQPPSQMSSVKVTYCKQIVYFLKQILLAVRLNRLIDGKL